MDFTHYVNLVVEFVKAHQGWAAPIVFLLAFGESLAFLSLLLPASVILLGIGALMGASNIPFIPVCIAAAVGSIIGYGVSYYLGLYYKDDIPKLWPFSKYPDMIPRGRTFFEKWGAIGVFLGHFFGPLRAVIPVVAGMYELKQTQFWAANVASSCIWAFGILAPGALGLKWLGFMG
jgi:membrane protein DedA with SNARE-associated domain